MKRVAIIGGGASGLMAAWHAVKSGAGVVVFEKQKKLGRKILASGNGRCNITNTGIAESHYHGHNPRFVHNVFARFGLHDTIEFFRSMGLPFVEGEKGRLFPASLQSSTVVDLFLYELEKLGVEISLHRRIDSIKPDGGKFIINTAGKENHSFHSVILAAGSCANPPLGASSIGYELAASLGHRIYEPFPSILPINIPMKSLHKLQGIKWNTGISVVRKGKVISRSAGELLFTGYGISGPAALDVSRSVNENINSNEIPEIVIDLYPDQSEKELGETLENLFQHGEKNVSFSLLGIMQRRMPEVLLEIAGIDPSKKTGAVTPQERRKILAVLKNVTLNPGKTRDFTDAVAAAGGVDVDQINGTTMESKLVRNLYITGELLDIDGDSGGYNLQFAWSTGAIAGMSQKQ